MAANAAIHGTRGGLSDQVELQSVGKIEFNHINHMVEASVDGRVHGHDELTNLAERLLRQISPENDVCRKNVNPKEKSRRDSEIQFSTFFWSPGIFGPRCGSKISGAGA